LPYFIEQAKPKTTTETYVKLEDIKTKEQANNLLQKKVWLFKNDFQKVVDKNAPLALLGFELIEDNALLGIVEEVIEQPHQLVVKTTIQNSEVLIPLHEHTLKSVDYKHQKIYVTLPEGLVDVYKQ
jgi:16S rRNA processing protein RimM